MPHYVRFEKVTSRGVLGHDVALDGNVLRERMQRGANKKTGKVGGGRSSRMSTFSTAAAAKTAFDKRIKELLAERFVPRGAPQAKVAARGLTVKGAPRPPTAVQLDAFETKHGIRLPRSYRRFVLQHGAGELLGFVRIHAPRAKGRQRLEALVRIAESPPLFPFADSSGGDLFGWVFGKRGATEPAVYRLARGAERPTKVAASFDAFVRGLSTNQRFVERLFVDLDADPTFIAR